jgi:hypothetical protein
MDKKKREKIIRQVREERAARRLVFLEQGFSFPRVLVQRTHKKDKKRQNTVRRDDAGEE